MWMDNCSAQNKNWRLLTGLFQVVNREDLNLTKVTLKYLEKGHTSMSADAVHQVCNKQFKKEKVVTDMEHFKSAISASSAIIEMKPVDFRDIDSGVSMQKLKLLGDSKDRPYLSEFKVVEVRRGHDLVFTKVSHTTKTWRAFDVMKNGFTPAEQPQKRKSSRGVNKEKLRKLKQALLPLIPPIGMRFGKASKAAHLSGS